MAPWCGGTFVSGGHSRSLSADADHATRSVRVDKRLDWRSTEGAFDDSKDDAGDGAGTSVIARLFGKDD
jgi:hypothetical protein